METLAKALPLKYRSMLSSSIKPLSKSVNSEPFIRDLIPFWNQVERVILGISPLVNLRTMRNDHIQNLTEYILGPISISYENEYFESW